MCVFGFRMSKSRIITFLPEKAMIPPKLMATNVLPSPLMVEVTAITLEVSF